MGIGYDGLHEMWDGYREGLSALALLAEAPGLLLGRTRRAAHRLAGSRRRTHPAGNPGAQSPGAAYPWTHLTEAVRDTGYQGAAQAVVLDTGRDRQLLP